MERALALWGVEMVVRGLEPHDPAGMGRYRIRGRLGAGGMGVVYLGTDGQRPVAIKVIDGRLAADSEFRARFRREIALAERVGGLCTAKVLDADPDAERPYLVTEYIPGPTLSAFVQTNGPMSGQPLTALAIGLAEALVAIHARDVVHRDLKPGNVLLGPHGPRVVDFGIASATDSTTLTHTHAFMGTPAFMSPEQTYGERATSATDIFAWGATVAFAATGRSVFSGPTSEVMLFRVRNDAPDLTGVEAGIAAVLRFALVKDPSARPAALTLLELLLGGSAGPSVVPEILTRSWADLRLPAAEPVLDFSGVPPRPVPPRPVPPRPVPPAPPAPPAASGSFVPAAFAPAAFAPRRPEGRGPRDDGFSVPPQAGIPGSPPGTGGWAAVPGLAAPGPAMPGPTAPVRSGPGDGDRRAPGGRVWLAVVAAAAVAVLVVGVLQLMPNGDEPPFPSPSPTLNSNCAAPMPAAVVGRWRGVINQPNPYAPAYPVTYTGSLELRPGCTEQPVGTWEIPEYGCAANITLIEPGGVVKLAARTTKVVSLCDPAAEVRVTARSDKALFVELFHTLPATGEPAATGLLSRIS